MTKKHFQRMAEIVHAILDGDWTNERPQWADRTSGSLDGKKLSLYDGAWSFAENSMRYTRAVQTAEAFIAV